MKSVKSRYHTKRRLTLLIHRDGTMKKILLYGTFKIRLCFTDLEHYHSNVHSLSDNLVYHNHILNLMMNSIYDEARKKYKMVHNIELRLDFIN